VKSIAGCGYRLVCPNGIQEQILERNEDVKHLVTEERNENKTRRNHGIHKVVVRSCNNGDQNEGRVSKTNKEIENLPEHILAHLAPFERAAEYSRMINHRHADAEGVAKVHRGHGRKLVDKLAAHPHALSIVVSNSIEEPIFFGEQAWWHAWVNDKGHESTKVCKCQGAASGRKRVERRRNVVVPTDEAVIVSTVWQIENGCTDPTVPGMWISA
jgi:hypothetical protein